MSCYPNREQALSIWQEGLNFRITNYGFDVADEYVFHTKGIAESCEIIAKQIASLNAEKAYVLGLLHDYGKKYPEKELGGFHGHYGYDEMMQMGFPDVARVCLTHSFYASDFNKDDYKNYSSKDLDWAQDKLKNIIFDDYDKLVQLCDMFFEGRNKVTFEKRFEGIMKRHNLSFDNIKNLYHHAEENKKYFDNKCGTDIYKLLGIL